MKKLIFIFVLLLSILGYAKFEDIKPGVYENYDNVYGGGTYYVMRGKWDEVDFDGIIIVYDGYFRPDGADETVRAGSSYGVYLFNSSKNGIMKSYSEFFSVYNQQMEYSRDNSVFVIKDNTLQTLDYHLIFKFKRKMTKEDKEEAMEIFSKAPIN